jgi:hypothetical protein
MFLKGMKVTNMNLMLDIENPSGRVIWHWFETFLHHDEFDPLQHFHVITPPRGFLQ